MNTFTITLSFYDACFDFSCPLIEQSNETHLTRILNETKMMIDRERSICYRFLILFASLWECLSSAVHSNNIEEHYESPTIVVDFSTRSCRHQWIVSIPKRCLCSPTDCWRYSLHLTRDLARGGFRRCFSVSPSTMLLLHASVRCTSWSTSGSIYSFERWGWEGDGG